MVSRCDLAQPIHQALLSPSCFFSPSHFRFGLWRGNSDCERVTCQDKNHTLDNATAPSPYSPGICRGRLWVEGGAALPGSKPQPSLSPAVLLNQSVPQYPHLSNGDNNFFTTGAVREGSVSSFVRSAWNGACPE